MSSGSKTRALVFVDAANITCSAKHSNKFIDWPRLREYLENYGGRPREIVEMVIYLGLPPATDEWAGRIQRIRGFIQYLERAGFLVFEHNGQPRGKGSFKANVDVVMALDAMDRTRKIQPDTVILATGDSDFAYLALKIRDQGIEVEVASVPRALGSNLRNSASGVIDLSELIEGFDDYRPAGAWASHWMSS
jgi:uncharacterized LabA/DUF88 family protein